ncbi:MAG: acetyl-CoA carboxylase biotin carboxyl carrier protein subunit [Caulobacteraceae bacterium]|nr:acetyl-CoA carboxylase biotin carboxyl carrier protein subunit [Caulobacteraceae bacterium]
MATRVLSEITGNIWKIEIADGALVAAGDLLITMESMKMEIPVEAPAAGRCRLQVAEGESVQEGAVLAIIEPQG